MRWSSLPLLALVFSSLFVGCGGGDDPGGGGGGAAATDCVPTAAECYVSGKGGPGAECLAKTDNTGQAKWQGRITQIDVQSPAALAGEFIQEKVIDKGIDLNQPACWEGGDGTFSWLYEIDPSTSTIHTGGALPITDVQAGACMVTLQGAIAVAPIDAPVTIDADGLGFHAADINVNVPIFISATNTSNPLILPLHQVTLDAKFNDDSHNCIGHFNGSELELVNNCKPDTKAIPPQRAWTTAAQLAGYITIDEADQVFIDLAAESLCALLAGIDFKGPDGYCNTSTKWTAGQKPTGDWCSTTNAAADAGCSDAWQLKGNFSAAAFKITGDCP
jgi:hypothetical protein